MNFYIIIIYRADSNALAIKLSREVRFLAQNASETIWLYPDPLGPELTALPQSPSWILRGGAPVREQNGIETDGREGGTKEKGEKRKGAEGWKRKDGGEGGKGRGEEGEFRPHSTFRKSAPLICTVPNTALSSL